MRTNSELAGNHLQFNSPEFGLIRTAGTAEQPLFCLADIMARAVLVAQATIERQNKQLKEQQQILIAQGDQIAEMQGEINEMQPKAKYFDRVMQSKATVTTTQIAADYGMSAMKFNALLNRLRVQRKVNDQWILYAPYNTMGYVHSETFIPANSTTGKVVMQTKWTQKGRLFLYKVLKSKGVLPVIEREDDMPAGLLVPTYSSDVEHVTR